MSSLSEANSSAGHAQDRNQAEFRRDAPLPTRPLFYVEALAISAHKGEQCAKPIGAAVAEAHPSALLAILAVAIFVRTICSGSFVP